MITTSPQRNIIPAGPLKLHDGYFLPLPSDTVPVGLHIVQRYDSVLCNLHDFILTHSCRDTERDVQAMAMEAFRKYLTKEEQNQLEAGTTFQNVLDSAQKELEKCRKPKSKASQAIRHVASTLVHYAEASTVMATTNSPITSLTWGGLTVLLKVCSSQRLGTIVNKKQTAVSHHETLDRLAEMFDEIFCLVGRMELYRSLFTLNRIDDLITKLYSYILDFAYRALRFYRKSRLC
jgi:hypothetical protein